MEEVSRQEGFNRSETRVSDPPSHTKARARRQQRSEDTEVTAGLDRTRLRSARPVGSEFHIGHVDARAHGAVDVSSLLKGYVDPRGRRASPRFTARVSVLMYNDSKTFRTTTHDISINGALLNQGIPKSLSGDSFEALFTFDFGSQREYFLVRAEVIGGPKSNRVRFRHTNWQSRLAAERVFQLIQKSNQPKKLSRKAP